MKTISLPENKISLVDDVDYERVCIAKWYINNSGYASTKIGNKFVLMHRLILNAGKLEEVHHVNENKLDNRKENLVFCSRSQNLANRKEQKNNTTGYKGVSYDPKNRKFRATIQYNRKTIALGRFKSAQEAATAYNKAAIEYYGEFAHLNQVGQ